MTEHVTITDPHIHEPKDVSTAPINKVYLSNGAGSGAWADFPSLYLDTTGADAEFERTVTFPDGEVREEVWKSHYVPWTEVCLIGVEELTTATSTDEVVQE